MYSRLEFLNRSSMKLVVQIFFGAVVVFCFIEFDILRLLRKGIHWPTEIGLESTRCTQPKTGPLRSTTSSSSEPIIFKSPLSERKSTKPAVDEDNKIIFCIIPKNMATQIKAALCRRFGFIKNFTDNTHHDYVHHICRVPTIGNMSVLNELLSDPSWLKLAIVRDPIERFISAFVDKCRPLTTGIGSSSKCFDLGNDFKAFVQRFSEAMEAYSVRNIQPAGIGGLVGHFNPQYWKCGFEKFYKNYKIIKMGKNSSNFTIGLRQILNKFDDWVPLMKTGWGPLGDKPFMEVKEHESPNKTRAADIRLLLQRDLSIADTLYRTFYVDYVGFGLTVPTWIVKNCHKTKIKLSICQGVPK